MDKLPGCPAPGVLAELIQGNVDEPELSELALHLETCRDCQDRVPALSPNETLIELLRGDAPVEDQIARSVPRPLVEKLKQIPRREPDPPLDPSGVAHKAAASPPDEDLQFLAPAERPDEIGRLGPYRVLEVLGKGGMGVVLLAEDPRLERRVALKVLAHAVIGRPTAKERFLREARAAARVKSDHIVTVHQVDEAAGVPYLAMELLEGQSLADVCGSGRPLAAAEIVHIARGIATGLAAAHEKGLVHRDIKPGNLWVEGEPGTPATGGRIKILDFGLAHAEATEAHLTQIGTIVGTPAYMAPEQARGEKGAGARADLFSLGCVLYHLGAGEAPFQADTVIGTLLAVAVDVPRDLSKLNAALSPALSRLIMQLLEKDPARRPASAREVLARLTEIERSVPHREAAIATRGPWALAFAGLVCAALAVAAAAYFRQTLDGRSPIAQAGKKALDSRVLTPPTSRPIARAGDVATILTSPDYEWTEPAELGSDVNPGQCYGTPFVSGDGLELSFDMLCDEKVDGFGGEDLWISRRRSLDAPWGPPVNLGTPINTKERDRTPTLSADGLTMIFWRYLPFCLFETNRTARDASWSEPVKVEGSDNGGSPVLSSDALELYSNQLGKICRATRADRRADWGPPEPVNALQAPFWREPCWLSEDGRWLLGVDRKDDRYEGCWLAHRSATGQPWGAPQPVDLPASLHGLQFPFPALTPAGLDLYFSRDNKLHVVRRVSRAGTSAADRKRMTGD